MEVRLKFSEQEIEELVQLLEQREGVEIECIPQLGGGIWLHDPTWEMELRLLLLLNYKVTVSRVCFIHKRQGDNDGSVGLPDQVLPGTWCPSNMCPKCRNEGDG